ICIVGFLARTTEGFAAPEPQDSLVISMQQAEDSFLTKNLSLIAQNYSIDSAKATVITAKLWDNPELDFSNSFYNTVTHHFFDPEESIQVSQLIRLAGKRNKAINLARSGIDIAQDQFYDLLRTLRYILRNDFYNIYFLEQSAKLYDLEISSLQKLVPAFESAATKGYLAPMEVLRIKSQLYSLQAEYDGLQTNIDNIQAELKLILRVSPATYIIPAADTAMLNTAVVSSWNYQALIDTAITNRPDLKVLNAAIVYNNNNLVLQKAFAKPDLTVGANYDRLGSYVQDYNSIGISIPLPFFNRNQGNIKNAKIQVDQSKVQYESGLDHVRSDVTTSYITASRAEKLLLSFDPGFDADIKHLIQQVTLNYQKRNITMLEFLDFYDSYKQNVLQLNQLRFNKMSALEQLNFSTGKIIFNP
ncbi:MAG: TolC family protein, partial [Bacteroidota bacterium]|nr:TolC family protein [Bacteroidota bacterium]